MKGTLWKSIRGSAKKPASTDRLVGIEQSFADQGRADLGYPVLSHLMSQYLLMRFDIARSWCCGDSLLRGENQEISASIRMI